MPHQISGRGQSGRAPGTCHRRQRGSRFGWLQRKFHVGEGEVGKDQGEGS